MKGEIFSISGNKGLIFIIYKEPLQRNEREEMGEEYEEVVYRSGAPNYLQVWKEMLKVISDQRNANSKSMRYYLIFIRLENWKTVLSAAGGGGNRDVGVADTACCREWRRGRPLPREIRHRVVKLVPLPGPTSPTASVAAPGNPYTDLSGDTYGTLVAAYFVAGEQICKL